MVSSVSPVVNLVLLGETENPCSWPSGKVWSVKKSPEEVAGFIRRHAITDTADAWFFWDSEFGRPEPDSVLSLLSLPGDVWHAGLRLGLAGQPGLFSFVRPTWTLNRDPDPDIVSTSWRLSLRACLIRASVLRSMEAFRQDFESLEAAALEMGYRFIRNGVILRHVPWLINEQPSVTPEKMPFFDEVLFVFYAARRKWTYWALGNALAAGYATFPDVFRALRKLRGVAPQSEPSPFMRSPCDEKIDASRYRVSVLIPTLDRYEFLRKLLDQLRNQTVSPLEIIVVDQTAIARRANLVEEYKDLPLKLLYLDRAGQCSARNTGLAVASGDYILFLDDDDEVSSDLIQAHLSTMQRFQVPVSSGIAIDKAPAPASDHLQYVCCSDVFPTGNTLILRSVLEPSGLFDLAYDCGDHEDGDLGMRIYLTGVLMLLNPSIQVLHHHAPTGGLRTHGANVITYKQTRTNLLTRRQPSPTLIYLWKRYFTPLNVKHQLRHSTLGTFFYQGNRIGKIVKILVGILALPQTLWRIKKNAGLADQLLKHFPQFPILRSLDPSQQEVEEDALIRTDLLSGSG